MLGCQKDGNPTYATSIIFRETMDATHNIKIIQTYLNQDSRFKKWWKFKKPLRPQWMKTDDGLYPAHQNLLTILNEGYLTWGAIVQANNMLWRAGESDCPCDIIYTDIPCFSDITALGNLSSFLYSLKETVPEREDLQDYIAVVTNERIRTRHYSLPKDLIGVQTFASGMMVYRQHLPNRYLQNRFVPIMVHPSLKAVMIIPSLYWTQELKNQWTFYPR
jgi:hypothetical protein